MNARQCNAISAFGQKTLMLALCTQWVKESDLHVAVIDHGCQP